MAINYPYTHPTPVIHEDISIADEILLREILQQKEPTCDIVRDKDRYFSIQLNKQVECERLFLVSNSGEGKDSTFWRGDFIKCCIVGAYAAIKFLREKQ